MNKIEILFVSSLCSGSKYKLITKIRTTPSLDPAQRMFYAMIEGMINNNCNVTCISALPVGTSNMDSSHKMFLRSEEFENQIHFIYPTFRIGKICRLTDLYKNVKKEVKEWIIKTNGKSRFIICDSLLIMCTIGTKKLGKSNKIKTFAYVTDYPSMATNIKTKNVGPLQKLFQKLYDKCADYDLRKYDGYILVAEALKDLIKIKKKPYVVVEDVIVIPKDVNYMYNHKNKPFTIVYGGALCERFGVNKLANAVMQIPNKDIVIRFYGSGESIEYLKKLNLKDSRIQYCGQVSFEELQKIQREANLLVNPRPSNESFSAYSFPSKTLSYMLSSTPVLSTRIPGIPECYKPYLLWFDEEDVDSMAKKIEEVISIPVDDLEKIGKKAYEYVINEKNCDVQAKKILSFMECENNE